MPATKIISLQTSRKLTNRTCYIEIPNSFFQILEDITILSLSIAARNKMSLLSNMWIEGGFDSLPLSQKAAKQFVVLSLCLLHRVKEFS